MTYPIPPQGSAPDAGSQATGGEETSWPREYGSAPAGVERRANRHRHGSGLSAPPPAPAPVRDPHPTVSTDWNYVPPQPASVPGPAPAEWGWRARVRGLTAGVLAPGPGREEAVHRAAVDQIRSAMPGSRTIVIANEKGGAGKTPAALILSAMLAEYRREAVVAWDVNELRGTLGRRAEMTQPPYTVTDVLAAAADLARPETEVGLLSSFLRRQPEGNLVLASSEDGNAMRQIGHAECDIVRQLLLRRYGLVVCDTGNNAAASNFLYPVDSAEVLVLPTAPSEVHLEVARAMLRMLAGRETTRHLVSSAVLVVTSTTGARLEPEVERWFADRIGRVVHVPADPMIAEGGSLAISKLSAESRAAWTQVTAAVVAAAVAPSPHDRPRGRRRAPEPGDPSDATPASSVAAVPGLAPTPPPPSTATAVPPGSQLTDPLPPEPAGTPGEIGSSAAGVSPFGPRLVRSSEPPRWPTPPEV